MVARRRPDAPGVRLQYFTSEQIRTALVRGGFHLQRAQRTSVERSDFPRTPLEWAERHRHPRGTKFSLDRYRPLIDLYADDHRHIVVTKPAQVGVSEWAVTLACFALDVGAQAWGTPYSGLNVAYIFPYQKQLNEFSKERIGGLPSESDYLASLFGSNRYADITFKQVRNSYLYMRGGWSTESLRSFRADLLILDERDELSDEAVALSEKRLNASDVKRRVELSTPTLPRVGIHEMYMRSDRRQYFQRCPHCSAFNLYDFFRDVKADGAPWEEWQHWDAERLYRADIALHCPSCDHALDEEGRCARGEWVAEDRTVLAIRGYQIPPLAFQSRDLTELALRAIDPNPTMQTEFYRSDLGLPYHASGSKIDEEMLVRLSVEYPSLPIDAVWYDTTMGIDVGKRLHVQIASRRRSDGERFVRFMRAVSSFDELDGLITTYKPLAIVVDAQPEGHAVRAFGLRYPHRVYLANYPTDKALSGQLFSVRRPTLANTGAASGRRSPSLVPNEPSRVQINRTMVLDAVYSVVATHREHWPVEVTSDAEVRSNMTALSRIVRREDGTGQDRAYWIHSKDDHFAHAMAYRLIADQIITQSTTVVGPPRSIALGMKGWGIGS